MISDLALIYVHSLMTFLWGLVSLLMGIILFFFNIPEKETLKTYRVSVRVLSIDYLILAVLVFFLFFFGMRDSTKDIIPIYILLINISQAVIMPFVFATLYTSLDYVRKNTISHNIIPGSILIFLYVVSATIFGDPICGTLSIFFSRLDHPTVFLRLLLLLFYVYQMTYYALFLKKQSARYYKHVDDYYSDTLKLKPTWVNACYYFTFTMGLMGIAATLIEDLYFDCIFTFLFLLFYFVLALVYMQYKSMFLQQDIVFVKDLSQYNVPIDDKQQYRFNWEKTKSRILTQKLYLQSGITVNDMAALFQTNRTSFSNALNKNEEQSFSSFINQLRIEEARRLMTDHSEMSLTDIALQCGFTEQSNFTRQFKLLCNETPAVWKDKNKARLS